MADDRVQVKIYDLHLDACRDRDVERLTPNCQNRCRKIAKIMVENF